MNHTDPAETDLAWRGYSGWAMLPSFAVCILLSAVLLMGGWFFDEIRGIGERVGSLAFFYIVWAIWIVQGVRWLYRGATYVYRLTPRHIFIDRGFMWPPEPAIDLTKVTRIEVGSNALARLFGAGWLCVYIEGREPVCLSGLLRPKEFARLIEAAVKSMKNPSPGPSPKRGGE